MNFRCEKCKAVVDIEPDDIPDECPKCHAATTFTAVDDE